MDWELLRTFEAVARLGSLTAAAAALGVSQSTVSRHLARLERLSGTPLLLRGPPAEVTARGQRVLEAVRPMVDAALAAGAALDTALVPTGEVTVTTVGEVIRWALVPRLAEFVESHPLISLRLLSSNAVSSLSAGPADIALRMARPETGDLVARKVGEQRYGVFAAECLELSSDAPWMGLTGSLDGIAEQSFARRLFGDRIPRVLVEDVESLGLLVERGLGVAVLPHSLVGRLTGVVEVEPTAVGARTSGPFPVRSVWLVVHRAKQHVPRVRAVMDWLIDILAA